MANRHPSRVFAMVMLTISGNTINVLTSSDEPALWQRPASSAASFAMPEAVASEDDRLTGQA
ncbi:hypothetical protein [Methylobacterium sp. J-067]|uniref:hypothetical protein n=1 Tax=Methylobacterium sp. J-067 TaxID=2836648 RepID=UPI001FBB5473|nr:hypothetical protein [Methylobacterium sp. J-067]MCJ2023290.1 hypothetical protein [Methylobacterium sp. J-067]